MSWNLSKPISREWNQDVATFYWIPNETDHHTGPVSQCANEATEPGNPVKHLESFLHFLQEEYIKINFWAFFGVHLCIELDVSDWGLSPT